MIQCYKYRNYFILPGIFVRVKKPWLIAPSARYDVLVYYNSIETSGGEWPRMTYCIFHGVHGHKAHFSLWVSLLAENCHIKIYIRALVSNNKKHKSLGWNYSPILQLNNNLSKPPLGYRWRISHIAGSTNKLFNKNWTVVDLRRHDAHVMWLTWMCLTIISDIRSHIWSWWSPFSQGKGSVKSVTTFSPCATNGIRQRHSNGENLSVYIR